MSAEEKDEKYIEEKSGSYASVVADAMIFFWIIVKLIRGKSCYDIMSILFAMELFECFYKYKSYQHKRYLIYSLLSCMLLALSLALYFFT